MAPASCSFSLCGRTTVMKRKASSFSFCLSAGVRLSSRYSCLSRSYWGQWSSEAPEGELRTATHVSKANQEPWETRMLSEPESLPSGSARQDR